MVDPPRAGRSRFPLRREEDVGFGDGQRVQDQDRRGQMLDVLKGPFRWPGSSSTPVLSEKLVTDNVVSELKSNRAQGRVGPGDPRGGTPPSGRPPGVYYADLTLEGRAITVKLLVREHKRDSRTQARYLYTTDLSLSEEVEEACLAGDRGAPRDVKALGLLVLDGRPKIIL